MLFRLISKFKKSRFRDRYTAYLRSDAWRNKRRQRLDIDHWRCVRCHSKDNLEVHHKTYKRLGNERMGDLVTLCATCHGYEHGKGCLPRPVYNVIMLLRRAVTWT